MIISSGEMGLESCSSVSSLGGAAGRIRTCEPLRERISHLGALSQSVDLESFTFDLAWLPQHRIQKCLDTVLLMISRFRAVSK